MDPETASPETAGPETARSETLIELRGVTFGYGDEVVLDNVDLDVSRRDFLAVIGPNGGGKTTLLKIMLGLLRPWSGTVLRQLPRRRGAIGYVPQFAAFDRTFPLRVTDVALMGRLGRRRVGRRWGAEDKGAVTRVLERLRLADVAQDPIGDLSGGQLQRTLIARALVSDPEVLFLDEPMASIDSVSRDILAGILEELKTRIPIVVVTHDLTPFASLVDQVACVNRRLHYHPSGELEGEWLEEIYGCPVELFTHGVPHRVLPSHDHGDER